MSAVAFRPGRSFGGGFSIVIVTLKSLGWLPVLAPRVVWAALWLPLPRTSAEEPISVTSPFDLEPLERVDLDLRLLAELEVAEVGLVDHHLALHHRQVGHGHDHGGAEALRADHHLALFLGQVGDDAVHRRVDGRLVEVVAGAVELGLQLRHAPAGGFDAGRLHLELGLGLVEGRVGDQPVVAASAGCGRRPASRPRGRPRCAAGRPGRRRRRPRPGAARLVALGLDPGQQLALLHAVALDHVDLDQAARDVGADVDVAPRPDLARGGDDLGEVLLFDLARLDRRLLAVLAADAEADDARR